MRLVWGAKQQEGMAYPQALHQMSHNEDGSRFVMFGNDISIGKLLVITEANSRMAEQVITKTVPEFLNDSGLGFTQHATKVSGVEWSGRTVLYDTSNSPFLFFCNIIYIIHRRLTISVASRILSI
jgi:hypothetical protein